ncbi:MAG TPA: hypothetical protein VMW53_06840 [archaeon]|nr:hypothetical protein [archaeon]
MAILTVLILTIILSGCIDDSTDDDNLPDQDVNSLVIIENLPEGYEILGTYPDFSEYNNDYENIIDSGEGLYRDQNNNDVYLDVIEFDTESNAINFIEEYKSRKESVTKEDIFSTVIINGKSVTRMKTYSISQGTQEPRYSFFWNDNKYVYIVKSNSNDENSALNIVKAII